MNRYLHAVLCALALAAGYVGMTLLGPAVIEAVAL